MNKKNMIRNLKDIIKEIKTNKEGKEITGMYIHYNKHVFENDIYWDYPEDTKEVTKHG